MFDWSTATWVLSWFLWSLLIFFVLASAGAAYVYRAVHKKQKEINDKIGPLDLSGRTFRRSVAALEDEHRAAFDHIISGNTLRYNPATAPCLGRFRVVQLSTECIFAPKATLWGSPSWDNGLSFSDNISASVASFRAFCDLGRGLHLDGYLLEIRGQEHVRKLTTFACAFARALTILGEASAANGGVNCMKWPERCAQYGWWFEFCGCFLFVTSFGPFYPSSSSRHQFSADQESAYILFQPEYSFAWHNVECDPSVQTNWTTPDCIRDSIRIKYRKAGRNYIVPSTPAPSASSTSTSLSAPASTTTSTASITTTSSSSSSSSPPPLIYVQAPSGHDMVKPLNAHDPVVRWWEHAKCKETCQE